MNFQSANQRTVNIQKREFKHSVRRSCREVANGSAGRHGRTEQRAVETLNRRAFDRSPVNRNNIRDADASHKSRSRRWPGELVRVFANIGQGAVAAEIGCGVHELHVQD